MICEVFKALSLSCSCRDKYHGTRCCNIYIESDENSVDLVHTVFVLHVIL